MKTGATLAILRLISRFGGQNDAESCVDYGFKERLAVPQGPVSYTHLDVYKRQTIEGLASLRSAEEVAKMRGKTVEELLG